jgi:hypothetical protein
VQLRNHSTVVRGGRGLGGLDKIVDEEADTGIGRSFLPELHAILSRPDVGPVQRVSDCGLRGQVRQD